MVGPKLEKTYVNVYVKVYICLCPSHSWIYVDKAGRPCLELIDMTCRNWTQRLEWKACLDGVRSAKFVRFVSKCIWQNNQAKQTKQLKRRKECPVRTLCRVPLYPIIHAKYRN